MFTPGKQVGAYTIDRPVARGRSGTVYRAQTSNGAPVALKVHDNADAAAAEVACLRALEHPGVVGLVEQAQLPNGATGLALPWIEGETLGHLLDTSSPLPLDRTRHIIDQLASASNAR